MENEKTSKRITKYQINEDVEKKLNAALDEVLSICQVNNFPVFISAAVANDKDRTEYKNLIYSSTAHFINLKDDKIRKYMLIANGFEAVPPREVVSFDLDDLEDLEDLE